MQIKVNKINENECVRIEFHSFDPTALLLIY